MPKPSLVKAKNKNISSMVQATRGPKRQAIGLTNIGIHSALRLSNNANVGAVIDLELAAIQREENEDGRTNIHITSGIASAVKLPTAK